MSVHHIRDTVSERLRRWTRNPLGSARRGSNPLGVVLRIAFCSARCMHSNQGCETHASQVSRLCYHAQAKSFSCSCDIFSFLDIRNCFEELFVLVITGGKSGVAPGASALDHSAKLSCADSNLVMDADPKPYLSHMLANAQTQNAMRQEPLSGPPRWRIRHLPVWQ